MDEFDVIDRIADAPIPPMSAGAWFWLGAIVALFLLGFWLESKGKT